jgi:putative oxidoreductase
MSTTTTTAGSVAEASKPLHVALWVVQGLLALAFGLAGWMKLTKSLPDLAGQSWTGDVPTAMVRFIGVAELAGALGLVLPSLTRIVPGATPVAATGLTTIAALAVAFHVYRGDLALLVIPIALGLGASFVAWGRFRKAPISPR